MLFPQLSLQSLSVAFVQPAGQQPSPPMQALIAEFRQTALQLLGLPIRVSWVQASLSSQLCGQSPSQVSPESTMSLPQVAEQSLSVAFVQPAGQQPSPSLQPVIGWKMQVALQLFAAPVRVSWVQALLSSQLVGQLPSQVSPGSIALLPQVAEQSLSVAFVQPAGQQPSPLWQAVSCS